MASPSIYQILAAINPVYAANAQAVYDLKKKSLNKATEKAEPKPEKEFQIQYDSNAETLEPVYFWILDFMNGLFGGKVEKLEDNFTSSPGSEDFLHTMDRAKRMQDSAMNIYGTVNTVIKSILNIIYDLKEFQIRLKDYDRAKSEEQKTKEAGMISLKQLWLDKVDITKGNTSIKAMAFSQASFATLIDAFMFAKSLDSVESMDLNDRVKRILEARIAEFLDWRERSEVELRKRFEIEKTYLRTQVDALKMYSKWARPYLKAASDLMMKDLGKNPALVKAFNTMFLQLTIMGKSPLKVYDEAINKNLPQNFADLNPDKAYRKYYSCVFVDFTFRGIPSRVGQNVAYGGRVEVNFKAYSLNQEELDLFEKKFNDSSLDDSLKLVEGMTSETLERLKSDIDEFLSEEKKPELSSGEDINPFSALFGFGGKYKEKISDEDSEEAEKLKKKAKLDVLEKEGIKKDNYYETFIRALSKKKAVENCYQIYDIYKKAHAMASAPGEGFIIKYKS